MKNTQVVDEKGEIQAIEETVGTSLNLLLSISHDFHVVASHKVKVFVLQEGQAPGGMHGEAEETQEKSDSGTGTTLSGKQSNRAEEGKWNGRIICAAQPEQWLWQCT